MNVIELPPGDVELINVLLKRRPVGIRALECLRSVRVHLNDGSDATCDQYWSDEDQGDRVTVIGAGRVKVIYKDASFWGLQIDGAKPERLQEDFLALKEQSSAAVLTVGWL